MVIHGFAMFICKKKKLIENIKTFLVFLSVYLQVHLNLENKHS